MMDRWQSWAAPTMRWLGTAWLSIAIAAADTPAGAMPLDEVTMPRNFRLHFTLSQASPGVVRFGKLIEIPFETGTGHDLAIEFPTDGKPILRRWTDGKLVPTQARVTGLADSPIPTTDADSPWLPIVIEPTATRATIGTAWLQPLELTDHAKIVRKWNSRSLKQGRQIYASNCIVCHGTAERPGSLPTSRLFHEQPMLNGADPYSMFRTLQHGYKQMPPQPQYTTFQKYAVIQYIREEFFTKHQPSQLTPIDHDYLKTLPFGMLTAKKEVIDKGPPPHRSMDFGPALFWTYEIEKGNIAQKGIAIRLDDGPGGVSKGKAWMIYDHDTMRVAAATTGSFIDWRGIAFDGSHGTHARVTGERHFVNPDAPGWASPDGGWEDQRFLGRDQKRYGPLPKDWVQYRGVFHHGNDVILSMEVGGVRVLESPSWIKRDPAPVFIRTLAIGKSSRSLQMRVAPATMNVAMSGDGTIERNDGFWLATLPSNSRSQVLITKDPTADLSTLANQDGDIIDLSTLTRGGPARWPDKPTTESRITGAGPFDVEELPLPVDNPWHSWMRPGGVDFTPDGRSAMVATWNGDVWRVDGIADTAPATLTWQRIASGLHQPLGLIYRDDRLFVLCRDQLVELLDHNGDGETDEYRCFNSDHQVTEHFHEFAMGLQTDKQGNFYYAKSGGHALKGIVPQHGTVLKIAADGSHTDIVATGLRTANGMCIGPDDNIWVTDQEGHWTPHNRINRIRPGGFHGYMLGYHDVTDESDAAMVPPVAWIGDTMDRSPAELVWVPKDAWGPLGGSLLNLSYGTGRVYVVPFEDVHGHLQGAVSELPIPPFGTGIMRGRFHPNGWLYTCGMYSWAGNATAPGGFYRLRPGAIPTLMPTSVSARRVPDGDSYTSCFSVGFSDPLATTTDGFSCTMKVWSIKRTHRYGSRRHDERVLPIDSIRVDSVTRQLHLVIPQLDKTDCYELTMNLKDANGQPFTRVLQGTLHRLMPPPRIRR